jgi:hypothetical protein
VGKDGGDGSAAAGGSGKSNGRKRGAPCARADRGAW